LKISKTTLTFLAVLLIIWIVNRSSANIKIKTVESVQPALRTAAKINQKINSALESKDPALAENKKLKAKVKILEARLAHLEEISLENKRLRKLLDFQERLDYESIAARVIGKDPSNWEEMIYIDAGSEDGIKEGAGVAADRGVVGKVVEIGNTISKVVLLNDPDFKLGSVVQRSREKGLVSGTLSRVCRMIYIPIDADVKIGDKVISSGSYEGFPDGLLIGEIIDIFEDRGGLYQSAIIEPSVDLDRLEEVLCIK